MFRVGQSWMQEEVSEQNVPTRARVNMLKGPHNHASNWEKKLFRMVAWQKAKPVETGKEAKENVKC